MVGENCLKGWGCIGYKFFFIIRWVVLSSLHGCMFDWLLYLLYMPDDSLMYEDRLALCRFLQS